VWILYDHLCQIRGVSIELLNETVQHKNCTAQLLVLLIPIRAKILL
jgi:hypothetical protein